MTTFDKEALVQRTLQGRANQVQANQQLQENQEEIRRQDTERRKETIARYVMTHVSPEMIKVHEGIAKAADTGNASYTHEFWVTKCYEEGMSTATRIVHVPKDVFELEKDKNVALRDAVLDAVVDSGLDAHERDPKPVRISRVSGLMDPVEEWYDSKIGFGVEISWLDETPAEPAINKQ